MKNSMENNNKEYTAKSYLEKEQLFSPEQEKFLEKEILKMNEDALQEDDYSKIYSKGFIERCKNDVLKSEDYHELSDKIKDLKSEVDENPAITREHRKVSNYLEALFYKKLGGENGWIPNSIVWKTSKYDDYINGVDFVVEAQDREFALATDLTFSHSKGLLKKLARIKHNINGNTLPSVTFYERTEETIAKPMPVVTMAVEYEKTAKALKLWADGQENLLDNHPMKAKTMLELEAQLESFAIYAKSIGRRNIASAYNDMLSKIQLLIINYENTIKKYREQIDDDKAYKTIMKFCEDLKKEAEKI
jgi:hypothetical protein